MKALQHRTEGDADFIYTPGQWGTGGTNQGHNQGHNQAGDARGTSKRGERRAFISYFNQCSISIHLVPVVLGEKSDEVFHVVLTRHRFSKVFIQRMFSP